MEINRNEVPEEDVLSDSVYPVSYTHLHGELEYGSPKKPALIEALALNLADNADAKLETMTEILKGAGDNMGWLGYNRFMESNVRRTRCV